MFHKLNLQIQHTTYAQSIYLTITDKISLMIKLKENPA